ncbi:MAG: hypothetical protein HYY24_00700 [Verrucomicrobia bacterium]|nr:hypothetical protein [Verrucomicrobiota bacterium]
MVNSVIAGLEALCSDPRYRSPGAESIRLRDYKRRVKDLDLLENVAFAALMRVNDADKQMTQLVGDIAEEIYYPLVPPVVSCQSQFYFQAYPLYNLLSVPQREVDFLLHLPDLYHELGHFLLTEQNNPVIAPFQKAHEKCIADALTHLQNLQTKPTRGPKADLAVLPVWEFCWVRAWAAEFCCDLFGVCASGPAYGWAHLHLCTKRGGDPFHVDRSPDSTHPSDEARMFVALEALTLLGYASEAAEIEAKWNTLLKLAGYRVNPDYERCFPKQLLRVIAAAGVTGYKEMKCRPSSRTSGLRLHDALNEAWEQFWKTPGNYPAWERKRASQLLTGRKS